MIDLGNVRCVWMRYFRVYQKNLIFGVVTTFVEPLLYLVSFGFGVGGLIGTLEVGGLTLSYRQFVFAGIMAQAVLFLSFFEAAYGSFIRMYYQRIFQAMAMTPITLAEILWGELLWDASRATFSATAVCLIGSLTGDFRPLGALAAIPVAFLSGLLFASMGLLASAKSRSIEDISYPQFLFVLPMFFFCGIFFPLDTLPTGLQVVAWALPLTSVVDLFRWLLLGTPLHLQAPFLLIAWLGAMITVARTAMTNRLVK
jgi:lipooligosaccharide transport system permease protein